MINKKCIAAIGGSYGTLSEISHVLQSGVSVIDLDAWSLSRNNKQGNSIFLAQNPTGAMNKALS